EQATRDIVRSAFQSAGQRCSALRVLYAQKDVAPKLEEMLCGAMDTLVVGDPWSLSTDVAPVIDRAAHDDIRRYIATKCSKNEIVKSLPVPETGLFIPPTIVRVAGIQDVSREVFGPVLHVAVFDSTEIEDVVANVNAKGFGLTFGLHSRIDSRVQRVLDRIEVGNAYVNRDQIGAIVGSQPFGGHGLSGTGPKAGGPHYLGRFKAGPDHRAPVHTGAIRKQEEVQQALAPLDASVWRIAPDRIARLRTALRGRSAEAIAAAAALDFGPIDLPGPTGEANQLELHARGRVFCLGPDRATLLAQTVQALAAGNAVLAVAPGAEDALRPLLRNGFPLAALEGVVAPAALGSATIDLVAFRGERSALQPIRKALAARSGPIVPIVTEVLAPAAYATERTICVDTTAAGGNASLLAQAEA
ncbi:MAG: aldehyde dehydrogenase family protein, partial [Pseudomonadota bacterium]